MTVFPIRLSFIAVHNYAWRAALVLFFSVLMPGRAHAGPQFILYQGRYLNNGLATGGASTLTMEFRITNGNAVACATPLPAAGLFWTSSPQVVATSSGVFSYKLGLQADQVTQDQAFLSVNWASSAATYYIDVCVSGASLTPHEPIGSTIYSIFASSAGGLGNSGDAVVQADSTAAGTGAIRLKTGATDRVYVSNTGGVGIGTTSPGTYSLATSSGVSVASGVYAGFFVGNGAGLTAVSGTDSSKLAKAGDAMSGPLTLAGSTLTVTGGAFSVAGATFVVSGGLVGVGTSSPASALHVVGPMTVNIRTVTGATAITESDSHIAADATGGGFTLTLPPASAATIGRIYQILEPSCANNITIAPNGADSILDISSTGLVFGCAGIKIIGLTATTWVAY